MAAQAFEAGDIHNIFLMFCGFWGSFSNKGFSNKKNVYIQFQNVRVSPLGTINISDVVKNWNRHGNFLQ